MKRNYSIIVVFGIVILFFIQLAGTLVAINKSLSTDQTPGVVLATYSSARIRVVKQQL